MFRPLAVLFASTLAALGGTTSSLHAHPTSQVRISSSVSGTARSTGLRTSGPVNSVSGNPTRGLADRGGQNTVLAGRLVGDDGGPIAGASVQLYGSPANQERARIFGVPDAWEDPSATSAEDGTFQIAFRAPRAFQFTLEAQLEGRSDAEWRWSSLPQGETVDLGDAVLWPAGTILARIVDTDGESLTEGWSIHAAVDPPVGIDPPSPEGGGRDKTRAVASAPDETGRFRLTGLPPGSVRLRAYSRITNWKGGPEVALEAGATVEARVVYDGPDPKTRITAIVFPKNTSPFELEDLELRLFGGDGEPRIAEPIRRSSQSFAFDGLEEGLYRMEVNDPRFLPWSRDGLQPESAIDVHLRGSASLTLDVVDPDGESVELYELRADRTDKGWFPSDFLLSEHDTPPPAGGTFADIVPGSYALYVRAKGFGKGRAEVRALEPGERREVRIELAPQTDLTGRLLTHAGAPVRDREVVLVPHVAPVEAGAPGLRGGGSSLREPGSTATRTDAKGRFVFEAPTPGDYDLRTNSEDPLGTILEGLSFAPGETEEVELRLPEERTAQGRLTVPDGASFVDLQLELKLDRNSLSSDERKRRRRFRKDRTMATPAADGSFQLGPVEPGLYVLSLAYPDIVRSSGMGVMTMSGPRFELARLDLTAEGGSALAFDIGDQLPGRIAVQVLAEGFEGSPPPDLTGAQVILRKKSPGMPSRATCELDAEGAGVLVGVPPGTYRLDFLGEFWCGTAPAVVVDPGQEVQTQAQLAFRPGTLRFEDPSGAPYAGRILRLRPGAGEAGVMTSATRMLGTDSSGQLEVMLPAGPLWVSIMGAEIPNFGPEEAVDWPPQGDAPLRVTLSEAK